MNAAHRLLLLSSSRTAGTRFLQHAQGYLETFLDGRVRNAIFIPYAAVQRDHDEYAGYVAEYFRHLGCRITSLHRSSNPGRALLDGDAIVVGGGNTFQLLSTLYRESLIEPLRKRIAEGIAYVGWSAGSNIACPSIRTTNDMPITWPPHCEALGLVPFQINPHYTDSHPSGHQGETRAERLTEFTAINPRIPVVGLREGSALQIEQGKVHLLGEQTARIFHGAQSWDAPPDSWLNELLQTS